MTKEEFEQGYCQRSGITLEVYREKLITMPCTCEYELCEGWAAIRNEPDAIEHQTLFYGRSNG